MNRHFVALATCIGLVVTTGRAVAEVDFPQHEITMIVPFAAGGAIDVVARILGAQISQTLGQTIYVENIIGMGRTTACVKMARADGYTLLFGHTGTHAVASVLNSELPYNPAGSFAPIALVSIQPTLILEKMTIKPFTVACAQRNPALPDIPTAQEAGVICL